MDGTIQRFEFTFGLFWKALRRFPGELVEERLKSLFGHVWSDTPFEAGLDGPSTGADGCKGRIELQIKRNENLLTSGKVLTWQHANHGVGFAV